MQTLHVLLPLLIVSTLSSVDVGTACTNFLVTPGASAEGHATISYNADSGAMFGSLGYYPPTNEKERTTYDWDTGKYIGEIPGWNRTTYNVVGNTNEHQLTIGETTFGGNSTLIGEGLLDYGSLIWVTLQRSRNVHEAITNMDWLTQAYGYTSSGESFSIADPNEVWIMEMVGKGKNERGSVWVAKRVPDGYVAAHANQARIRAPLTATDDCRFAADVVDFARSIGLYPADAKDEDFSFSDTFDPVSFSGARLAEARVWELFRQVSESPSFGDEYFDYVSGANLAHRMPLFIRPKEKLSLNQTFWLMRSHYEDSPLNMTDSSDVSAGAFSSSMRVRPLFWKSSSGKQYHNERPIGVQQTAWHFTAEMRPEVSSGAIVWFGVDDSSLSCHFPIYSKATRIPAAWVDKGIQHVDDKQQSTQVDFDTAFWVFNMVANLVYSRHDDASAMVAAEISLQEEAFFNAVNRIDGAFEELIKAGKADEAIETLTHFGVEKGQDLVSSWLELWKKLFFTFRDQLTITPPSKPQDPRDHLWPNALQQGYPTAWNDRIAEDTGSRYEVPTGAQAARNPKLDIVGF